MADVITTNNLQQTSGERLVMPVDDVTVYATDKVKKLGIATGAPMTLHREAANKLVASGKATFEAPAAAQDAKKK